MSATAAELISSEMTVYSDCGKIQVKKMAAERSFAL